MAGKLYIVATPIGNLEDVSARALRVLREVDLVACEDTRRTRLLLNHFSIKTKTISYHEHNEHERAEQLCKLIESGQSTALVSDAGTPLISDPGFRIVTAAIEHGISVVTVPGPAAFVAALVVSGLPTDQFFFAGFLPARAPARQTKLNQLGELSVTLIFYEAPHRIVPTLKDALTVLGDRRAVVARELTKMYEETVRGSLSELVELFSGKAKQRGEMVLMIAGKGQGSEAAPANSSGESLIVRVRALETEGLDAKEALKKAAREFGLKRADAYRLLVSQKNRRR